MRRTPEFYSIQGYAERLNVSQKTIRRLIGKGTLVGHKIGAVWRISQADRDGLRAPQSHLRSGWAECPRLASLSN